MEGIRKLPFAIEDQCGVNINTSLTTAVSNTEVVEFLQALPQRGKSIFFTALHFYGGYIVPAGGPLSESQRQGQGFD